MITLYSVKLRRLNQPQYHIKSNNTTVQQNYKQIITQHYFSLNLGRSNISFYR